MILATQFVITAAFVVAGAQSTAYMYFIRTNFWFVIVAIVVGMISMYALVCYPDLARSVPTNYILLAIFTVSEAFLVSAITTFFTPISVLYASCLTAAIVIGLTIYAFKTETDFTYMGGMLFVILSGFIMAGLLGMFFQSRTFDLIMAYIGACIFGVYLIYDTQLLIGGEGRAASYSIDDYILAAINIYLDVINIFLEILKIIGDRRD